MKSDELAEKRSWHKENTEIFLQTLRALGYISYSDGAYKNTENSNRYLVKDSLYYIGTFVLVFDSYIGNAFPDDFTELLENGPKETFASENMNVDYAQMVNTLRAYQSGYPQAQFRELLSEYKEYRNANKILDLGCGTGMIGLSFLEDNKKAEIVLYDIVFSSNSIYGAKMNIDETMNKIYHSLNTGGMFICVSDGVESDFSAPWDMVVSWLPYRMNNMDMSVSKNFVLDAALKSGFESISKKSLHLIGGRVDVDVFIKK